VIVSPALTLVVEALLVSTTKTGGVGVKDAVLVTVGVKVWVQVKVFVGEVVFVGECVLVRVKVGVKV